MEASIRELLVQKGFRFFPQSRRQIGTAAVYFARRGEWSFIATIQPEALPQLDEALVIDSATNLTVCPLTWQNYLALRGLLSLTPLPCDMPASFGTGDRLGMVGAAHLQALMRYPVFPVIAQQSPRELVRTGRDFRNVLLSAVAGVLETGYTGKFGADADHIKYQQQLMQAIEAGYSMYTIDVSDNLYDISALSAPELADKVRALTPLSLTIARGLAGKSIRLPSGEDYTLEQEKLLQSAVIFEAAMQKVCRFHALLQQHRDSFDLEVSIDESARVTTVEDHLYVIEYLRRSDVHVWSIAPRFPGKFEKGVDYRGDLQELQRALQLHAALCRELGGYRLSLHSGSDKFSVYPLLREATQDNFHVKTSGTSWLQAIDLIAEVDVQLFTHLYQLCLRHLEESKQAYEVSLVPEQFPPQPPKEQVSQFVAQPHVRQLFHISYGALLEEAGRDIHAVLHAHEVEHVQRVQEHIERHLQPLLT